MSWKKRKNITSKYDPVYCFFFFFFFFSCVQLPPDLHRLEQRGHIVLPGPSVCSRAMGKKDNACGSWRGDLMFMFMADFGILFKMFLCLNLNLNHKLDTDSRRLRSKFF